MAAALSSVFSKIVGARLPELCNLAFFPGSVLPMSFLFLPFFDV